MDAEGKVGINIIKPPPAIVRLTPKAELVSEYRARFFKSPANTVEAGQDGEKRGGREGREGGWLQMATSPGAVVPATAEADIESVIVQEAALQRRVEAERVHLATKVTERGDGKKYDTLQSAWSQSKCQFFLLHVQRFRPKQLLTIAERV